MGPVSRCQLLLLWGDRAYVVLGGPRYKQSSEPGSFLLLVPLFALRTQTFFSFFFFLFDSRPVSFSFSHWRQYNVREGWWLWKRPRRENLTWRHIGSLFIDSLEMIDRDDVAIKDEFSLTERPISYYFYLYLILLKYLHFPILRKNTILQ
jgi:hypothetical protein